MGDQKQGEAELNTMVASTRRARNVVTRADAQAHSHSWTIIYDLRCEEQDGKLAGI